MTIPLGLEAVLYFNDGGTWESPNHTEISGVRDVTLNLEKSVVDLSHRGSGWRLNRGALKDASISVTVLDDDGVGLAALINAWLASTPLEVLALNGPLTTPGSKGLRAVCEVMNVTRNEALEEGLAYDVELRPTPADNDPTWYTAA